MIFSYAMSCQKYSPCKIPNLDYFFYSNLYDSKKKERVIWYMYFNFLPLWFYEHLIKFTFDLSKTRKDSFLKISLNYIASFVLIQWLVQDCFCQNTKIFAQKMKWLKVHFFFYLTFLAQYLTNHNENHESFSWFG